MSESILEAEPAARPCGEYAWRIGEGHPTGVASPERAGDFRGWEERIVLYLGYYRRAASAADAEHDGPTPEAMREAGDYHRARAADADSWGIPVLRDAGPLLGDFPDPAPNRPA